MDEQFVSKSRVIILDEDCNTILLSHKPDEDESPYYIPVGGSVEAGETSLDAAKREVFEETGYFCNTDPVHIGKSEYAFVKNGIKNLHSIDWYILEVDHFQINMDNFTKQEVLDVVDIGWFSLNTLKTKQINYVPYNLVSIVEEISTLGFTNIKKIDH